MIPRVSKGVMNRRQERASLVSTGKHAKTPTSVPSDLFKTSTWTRTHSPSLYGEAVLNQLVLVVVSVPAMVNEKPQEAKSALRTEICDAI